MAKKKAAKKKAAAKKARAQKKVAKKQLTKKEKKRRTIMAFKKLPLSDLANLAYESTTQLHDLVKERDYLDGVIDRYRNIGEKIRVTEARAIQAEAERDEARQLLADAESSLKAERGEANMWRNERNAQRQEVTVVRRRNEFLHSDIKLLEREIERLNMRLRLYQEPKV